MAKLLKLRRGTTSQHSSFTGAEGEVTVNTDNDSLVVHDGSTAGGHELLRKDLSNAPAGVIDNADISSSANIAGTKISPNFGGQSIETTGGLTVGGNVNLGSELNLMGTEGNKYLDVNLGANVFNIRGTSGGDGSHVTMMTIQRNGATTIRHAGSTKLTTQGGGVDVTGNITATGDLTVSGGDMTINGTNATLHLIDSDNNPDWVVRNDNGVFKIRDFQNNRDPIVANTDGHIDLNGNVDISSGLDVTGNITQTSGSITAGGNIDISQGNLLRFGGTSAFIQQADSYFQIKETLSNNLYIDSEYVYLRDVSGNTKLNTNSGGVQITGTCTATSFSGDGSNLTGVTSTTINNNADNRIITGSGTANTLNGESGLTFDGTTFAVGDNGLATFNGGTANGGNDATVYITATTDNDWGLTVNKNNASATNYGIQIKAGGSASHAFYIVGGGSEKFRIGGAGNIEKVSHIYPSSNNTYDLGSSSVRWRNLYTNDLNLSNEGSSNDIDGSWGDWTIQEGESDLFLKNNRSGKKYKFNLTEVS